MRTGSISQQSVGNSVAQLVGASMARVRLQISTDAQVLYVTDQGGAAVGIGYAVTPSAPLIIDYREVGDLVTHAWYGSSPGGSAKCGIIAVEESS